MPQRLQAYPPPPLPLPSPVTSCPSFVVWLAAAGWRDSPLSKLSPGDLARLLSGVESDAESAVMGVWVCGVWVCVGGEEWGVGVWGGGEWGDLSNHCDS